VENSVNDNKDEEKVKDKKEKKGKSKKLSSFFSKS